MLRVFIKHEDGRVLREPTLENLRAAVVDPKFTFWLDMQKPTDEEIALLDDVFGFHPLAIEDTIGYVQRPKIESYNHVGDACRTGYFYMVFHGPDLETFKEKLRTKELDLFCSQRYLVTIHEEPMRSVEGMIKRAEADPSVVLDPGIDLLLHGILDRMVDHYQQILDYLDEALDDLEERALNDPKPEVLSEIAVKKRELLNLRRIVGPQREVLAQLTRGEVPFIRESTRVYLRDVLDHLVRTVEMIELYRDIVLGSRDIYLSSVSNNLNQVMKALTTFTVVALPVTLVTSFFGMNFDADKIGWWGWILTHPSGFWATLIIVMVLVVGILYVFRRKRWI